MDDLDLNALEGKVGNKYKLVVAVARRAQQLRDGHRPLVQMKSNNPITVALHEIASKEVEVDERDGLIRLKRGGELPGIFSLDREESAMDDLDDLDLDDVADLDVHGFAGVGDDDDEDLEEGVEED